MPSKPALAFDDSFVTGVDEIDTQHRILVDLTNEAAEVIAGNPTPTQVRALVRELLGYAIYHFRTEEQLMRQYAYVDADAQAHIARHRDFSTRIVGLQERFERHEHVDPEALVDYLVDWIRRHILGTDRELAAHILRCRAGGAVDDATRASPGG